MPEKKKKEDTVKKWFWIGGSLLGVALLLFVGLIVLNNWLHNKLEAMVQEESNGVYTMSLHNLQASPFTGILSVDSLLLKPDFDKWQEQQEQNADAPSMLMNLRSGKIELNGLSYWNVLVNNTLEISDLSIASPDVSITRMRQDTTNQEEPLHKSNQGILSGLKIDNISVQNAAISYSNNPDEETNVVEVKDFNLQVVSFLLDSVSFHNDDKAFYSKRISFDANETLFRSPDGFYEIEAGSVKVDTDSGSVNVASIKVKPLLDQAEMSRRKNQAATLLKGEMAALDITGIQFSDLSKKNQILVNKVTLNQPSLSLYKDKKNFQNKGIKPLPHDIVQEINGEFMVDTVSVQGMYIRYDELAEEATEPGHLYITHLNGTVTNLTNLPDKISMNKPAVVQANGRFMGEANMKATVILPLLEKNGYHTVETEVSTTDPTIINPILVPTNLLSIESGQLQSGYAKMELNREQATGSMRVLYKNFKIELLSESEGNEQSLGKKILSKAANKLAIKSDNPGNEGEEPRIGEITATRDKNRSVFTFWKDGLASGFLSSVGLDIIADK